MTILPGWTVRDVLAHCSAALGMAAAGNRHGFSPAENQVDVDHRRGWPVDRLLDELDSGYAGAAVAIASAGGRLDGLALGEWTHGGDVRDAFGTDDAYASSGVDDALALLVERSRQPRTTLPPTVVALTGRSDLRLGAGSSTAKLTTDVPTFVRLCGGRGPDPARYRLTGAEPSQYVIFR